MEEHNNNSNRPSGCLLYTSYARTAPRREARVTIR